VTRLRKHGESIAVLGGEAEERSEVDRSLTTVLRRWREILGQTIRTTIVSQTSGYLAPVLSHHPLRAEIYARGRAVRISLNMEQPSARARRRRIRQLLKEIVGSQHHRSLSFDWPFEELSRCSLLNRIAEPHKLIYSLICLHIVLAFKIVHRRGADRTPDCLALIKHREINNHPIEVIAQHFTSLQRHRKSSVLKGSDYAMLAGFVRCHDSPLSRLTLFDCSSKTTLNNEL
jgi:hypothetical protein